MNTEKTRQAEARPSRILLVDDEPSNRFLMRDILANSGYEIIEAENGRIALHAAQQEKPDTVLLDVMMPEMDGFETCRHLKSSETTSHIPVLMVSALCDRTNRLEGITAGAVDFITKPIDMRDMLVRVGHAVAGKRQLDDISASCQLLKAMESERDGLVQKIAHDMRSPLAAMTGNLQLLQMTAGEKLSAEELGFIQQSIEASEALLRQIEGLTPSPHLGSN
ncbi:MAG: two-component system sensor histidine kinase/response regulator [Verrucomicrobiales bacterium]|jgi:two-component system sensor histidine kinase/response regulator